MSERTPNTTNSAENQKNQPSIFENIYFCRILLMNFNAAICCLLQGQNVTDFNMVESTIIQLNDWGDKKDVIVGVINAMLSIGAVIGTLLFGAFSSKVGRFKSFIIYNVLGIVGSCIMIINNQYAFIFGRLLCGIAVGIASGIGPLQIVEITPTKIQGLFGGLPSFCIGFGLAFVCALSIPLPGVSDYESQSNFMKNYWRVILLIPVFFHLINLLILFLFFNFETPFYYVWTNRENEAKLILSKIYKENEVNEQQILLENFIKTKKEKTKNINFKSLFTADQRKQMIVFSIFALLFSWCGINVLNFYSKRIIIGTNDSSQWTPSQERNAIIQSIFLNLMQPAGTITSSAFQNRFGRKFMITLGHCLLVIITTLFSILTWKNINMPFILFFFVLIFGMFLAPNFWLQIGETLPDVGIALGVGLQWMQTIFMSLLFPVLNEKMKSEGVFGFLAGINVLGIFVGSLVLVETKGKTKEEIEQLFKSKKKNIIDENEKININGSKNDSQLNNQKDIPVIDIPIEYCNKK